MADIPIDPVRELTEFQLEAIERLCERNDGRPKHSAFMRIVLGETSYFNIALMSRQVKDIPLDRHTMIYIAERW